MDRTFTFAEHFSVNLVGEAFNIFNVTNILGISNLNYSGFANTLSPDTSNPSFSSSFGKPVSTAGGVFGSEDRVHFRLLQSFASDQLLAGETMSRPEYELLAQLRTAPPLQAENQNPFDRGR